MKKTAFKYQIFIPGGNDTALVIGLEKDRHQRRIINDFIMEKHGNIEQVGFINPDKKNPELIMAGGEFCGNATRSAAWYYLSGSQGEIKIKVSGVKTWLKAGVDGKAEAWAQMPVASTFDHIAHPRSGEHIVEMEGITHLIIDPEESKKYLLSDKKLQDSAFDLLDFYSLLKQPAAGVLFLEQVGGTLKMHPCVYVSAIDKMFYETACCSGTTAVGLLTASKKRTSREISVVQPSGHMIKASIICYNEKIEEARISGPIVTDGKIFKEVIRDGCL